MITQAKLKKLFQYKNGSLIWKVNISNVKAGSIAGSIGGHGYNSVQINSKLYKLHRLIFLYHHDYLPKYIDHIDGNKENNKIENLRKCSNIENCRNAKKPKNNISGFKGISWDKQKEKWEVRICTNEKRIYLGHFSNLKIAAQIIKTARIKYHGKFCNHG